MTSRRRQLWQVSLAWAGEVVAVEQQRGPLEAHPWVALVGGVTSRDEAGWREAARGELTVTAERVDEAQRSWHARPSRGDLAAALVTLALHLLMGALTFVRPPLTHASSDERATTDRPWLHEISLRWQATICPGEQEPLVVHRALTPAPTGTERPFRPRPAEEPSLPQTGASAQDHERAPQHANPSDQHARGLLDVESTRRPEGHLALSAGWYTVRPGDTLDAIARRVGLASYLDLYTDDFNPELRRLRPDPHRIFPGDRVRVPR